MLVLYFLKSVLVKNPIKLSLIAVSFILGILIVKVDDSKIKKKVITQFTDGGEYHYVTKDSEYDIKSFDEPKEILDGKISYSETHPVVFLSSVFLFLISLILFLASIGIEDSATWDFKECFNTARLDLVRCDSEDDIYYYHYKGKLILVSKEISSASKLERLLESPLNIYPDFPGTKEQRRDKKLKELFNES
jgi:hypothetical protein